MPDVPTTRLLSPETTMRAPREEAECEGPIVPGAQSSIAVGNRTRSAAFNPMQPEILASAPRCGARARTRGGAPCRSPAVRGSARCRMHGGKGSGAPRGNRNAWKHGAFSGQMKDIARYLRITSMVVKHANRIIWWAGQAPLSAAVGQPIPAPCVQQSPIDLGEQPHAPGNSAGKLPAIGAAGPVARPREAGASRLPPPRRSPGFAQAGRRSQAIRPGSRRRGGFSRFGVRPAWRRAIAAAGSRHLQAAIGGMAICPGPKSRAPPPIHKKMP